MTEAIVPTGRSSWLRALIRALRWGAVALSLVLILLQWGDLDIELARLLAVAAGLGLLAGVRGLDLDVVERVDPRLTVALELVLTLAGVLLTGGWASPFVPVVAIPVLMIAVNHGTAPAAAAAAGIYAVLAVRAAVEPGELDVAAASQALLLLGVGLAIGAFARRVVIETEEEHEQTLGRITQLGNVNAMLSTLHDMVRSMPAPLSVEEIVRVIRAQLDELFDADAVVLLMGDGAGDRWRPVYAEGIRVAGELEMADLPAPLRLRGPSQRPIIVNDLPEGAGLWDQARSGAYLWLWSRGQPSALLALEHRAPDDVPETQSDDLERLGVPLALAIDNAVWFQRLRTLGAEEERQRIGAELHDRFAQSLAYVAMELDRTVQAHPDDAELGRLREEVRSTLADLRETLRELRLNVSEDRALPEVLEGHLERFADRFGLVASFRHLGDDVRPPLPVEQQLLRITQDLLWLAQREMGATSLRVTYETRPGRIHLRVEDDGRGIPEPELGTEAAKILGVVRERADAVGATIEVVAHRGEGSAVQVSVRGLL